MAPRERNGRFSKDKSIDSTITVYPHTEDGGRESESQTHSCRSKLTKFADDSGSRCSTKRSRDGGHDESSTTSSTCTLDVTTLEVAVSQICGWDYNDFEGRKVIVRLDGNGEPCEAGECVPPTFASYYFARWLSFDPETDKQEYAECSVFPVTSSIVDNRGSVIDSSRRSQADFVMVPAKAVYFINPSLALEYIHPQQELFFPELMKVYGEPILQPFRDNTRHHAVKRVIIKSSGLRVSDNVLRDIPVIGSGIELRVSRIPNSGRGVFASRDFQKDEIVTLYFGHLFGESERAGMQSLGKGTHCKPLQFKHSYLDGVKTAFVGMHAGQLLNQGDKNTCNCEWIMLEAKSASNRHLAIRATRYIFPGEELYISYGRKFWDEQRMTPISVPPVMLPRAVKPRLKE